MNVLCYFEMCCMCYCWLEMGYWQWVVFGDCSVGPFDFVRVLFSQLFQRH